MIVDMHSPFSVRAFPVAKDVMQHPRTGTESSAEGADSTVAVSVRLPRMARLRCQTGTMTDDDHLWYYNVDDGTVSQGKAASSMSRMGPYPDRESAEKALQIASERNKEADRADDDWNN